MRIERALLDRIVAHARRDFPNECCGMIAMRDGRAVDLHEATAGPQNRVRAAVSMHGAIDTMVTMSQ